MVSYFPFESIDWFITRVLITSAGVPIIAARNPEHILENKNISNNKF